MAKVELKSKWVKAGIVRLSSSKKVVLMAIYELDSSKWLLVSVEDLLELIAGHRFDVPIVERDVTV
jgi:hypothetical protein